MTAAAFFIFLSCTRLGSVSVAQRKAPINPSGSEYRIIQHNDAPLTATRCPLFRASFGLSERRDETMMDEAP
jgi:hypothetical protein